MKKSYKMKMGALLVSLFISLGTTISISAAEVCPTGDEIFTALSFEPNELEGIVPLGERGGSHVLPVKHMYFRLKPIQVAAGDPEQWVYATIRAMRDVRIIAATYNTQNEDYDLHMIYRDGTDTCSDIRLYFSHLQELSPALTAEIGQRFNDETEYTAMGSDRTIGLSFDVNAAEIIGFAGGTVSSFDIGLIDLRKPRVGFVNPDRYSYDAILDMVDDAQEQLQLTDEEVDLMLSIVPRGNRQHCFIRYFPQGLYQIQKAMLYAGDPWMPHPAQSCGSHMQDVPDTAAGNWFLDATGHQSNVEDRSISIGPHWAKPDEMIVFSLTKLDNQSNFGVVDGIPYTAAYHLMFPKNAGFINRRPEAVVKGDVYCYEGLFYLDGQLLPGIFLVELLDIGLGQLKIEYIDNVAQCNALQTWQFSNSAQTLYR